MSKYDLSGGPSTQFGNDTSKMGHRDYTEWRKAGGSHDEFMEFMYDNPGLQAKGSNLVAELEEHGQNRDFREGDKNPENTDFGWLGWDNVGDFSYDKMGDDKKSTFNSGPYTMSEDLVKAHETIDKYKASRADGSFLDFYRHDDEPTVDLDNGQTNADPKAQGYKNKYTENLRAKMSKIKKGEREAFDTTIS